MTVEEAFNSQYSVWRAVRGRALSNTINGGLRGLWEGEDLRTGQVTQTVSYIILSVPSQAFGLVCEVQETFLFIDNRLVITTESGHLWSTM